MEFLDVVDKRRSIRAFLDKDVPKATIDRLIRAATLAPSAGDLQSYKITVARERPIKVMLAEAAYGQAFVSQAAIVMVFWADPERSASRYSERGRQLFAVQDATLAAAYVQLAATSLDLGSCWVGAFNEQAVSRALGEPAGLRPVAILPIGFPAEQPERPARRPIEQIVTAAEH